jgi:UDP-glucose 4-epimerase
MPFMAQVAAGKRDGLVVFGGDYPTADGTCRRDYLHVMDLAEGHFKALAVLQTPGCKVYNLGAGNPLSVLEVIHSFEIVNSVSIPYEIVGRRDGDLAEFWADPSKANVELDWHASRSIEDMMIDTWRWQQNNPNGFI